MNISSSVVTLLLIILSIIFAFASIHPTTIHLIWINITSILFSILIILYYMKYYHKETYNYKRNKFHTFYKFFTFLTARLKGTLLNDNHRISTYA